jgi:protochlorophyllide reductase
MAWTTTDIPDLTGCTVLVTGANAGLGLETSGALAAAGAEVLLACRNLDKAEQAGRRIRQRHPAARVRVVELDLADLDSVRRLADALVDADLTIDVLVNNAGLMAVDAARTAQGYEMQYGVNHLGHFALTARLLPLVLRSEIARVVNVSSMGHRAARGMADPTLTRRYDRWNAYFHSKLANLLFTAELHRRAEDAGSPLTVLAAHPGGSRTDLGVEGHSVTNSLARLATPVVAQSVEAGARPLLRAATDRSLPGGTFVGPRFLVRGRTPVVERPSRRARDATAARALWEQSVKQSGLDPAEALTASA